MTARRLYIDTETRCTTPIRYGHHRYAERATLMVISYAIDDAPVTVVDLTAGDLLPDELIEAWEDDSVEIWAHNSPFDRTILRVAHNSPLSYRVPAIERWRDTLVQALCHGLPGGLDKLSDIFRLSENAKLKDGKRLIKLFCGDGMKNRLTHPLDWELFLIYAAMDITSMRELSRKMPTWNYPAGIELARWHLDQHINDRGFAIDTQLCNGAIKLAQQEKTRHGNRVQELTKGEVERATQRDRLLKHLLKEYGVTLPDMTSTTIETRLKDEMLPWIVKELLSIRLMTSSSSITKFQALANAVNSDSRLRGSLQFSGAGRTGRWAGRLFQPQNLPRYLLDHIAENFGIERNQIKEEHLHRYLEDGLEAVRNGTADLVFKECLYLLVNLIRSVIIANDNHRLVMVDQSNIEGRVAAWLAGESWKLQAFRDYDTILGIDPATGKEKRKGQDLYLITAGRILNKDPEDVTKDERQSSGKVPELACNYQGALGAFNSMARLYGLILDDNRVLEIVRSWRAANANIVQAWYDFEKYAKLAIFQPGHAFQCGKVVFEKRGAWLTMLLPSGRLLCYPQAEIRDDKITFMGVCPYTKQWKRLQTYGGKLFENATQGTAAEVIKDNATDCEAEGFRLVLSVHDELVAEVPDNDNYHNAEVMAQIMTSNRDWMAGLPLAAKGFENKYYRKEA